jgi:Domain of unknown function (DUF4349)
MRVEDLERELRAERPEIDSDFARKLDDWAAAGFPRGGWKPSGGPLDALARFRDRLRTTPPRRILLPLGAAATLILVVGVGIKAIDDVGGGSGDDLTTATSAPATDAAGNLESGASKEVAPTSAEATVTNQEFDLNAPGGGVAAAPSAADVGPGHRKVAQKVDLSLSTAPADFRDAADGVLDVVSDHNGFVVSSSVSGGDPGVPGAQPGRADFRLKIPSRELPVALGALSDLGHVVSRTDGTEDITGRFVSAKQRIADLTKARQHLLAQLEDATTTTEQQSIKARLRIVEAQLDDAQGDLANAQQRVSLVPVSVSIASDSQVGATDEGGGWGIDDALHDAGDVLTVMGGVALITLAVLLPLGLIGAAAYALYALTVRRQRERALDA